jgi:hypothetical protein
MMTNETYRVFGLCAILASGMVTLACSDNSAGSGSGGKGGSSGTTSTTSGSPTSTTGGGSTTSSTTTSTGAGGSGSGGFKVTYCDNASGMWPDAAPVPVTMDTCTDFDADAGAEGIKCIMPGGVWAVDVDGAGTTKDMSWKIEPCGTTGNGFHFTGAGHSIWGADTAAAIVSQTQPVDVSAYTGMSFVMKSTMPNNLIFKVQNPYSQPPCGKCMDTTPPTLGAECYSGYVKNPVTLPANSTTPIVVSWSELAQQGWGYKAPGTAAFDPHNLVSVAFAFDKSIDFDVCIDDIKFVK